MPRDAVLPPDPASPCFILVASTGGVEAFGRIVSALRPPFPPVLAIQAMHPAFMAKFAERLRQTGPVDLKVVEEGDLVLPDRVLLATNDWCPRFTGLSPRVRVTLGGPASERGRLRRPVQFALKSAARV